MNKLFLFAALIFIVSTSFISKSHAQHESDGMNQPPDGSFSCRVERIVRNIGLSEGENFRFRVWINNCGNGPCAYGRITLKASPSDTSDVSGNRFFFNNVLTKNDVRLAVDFYGVRGGVISLQTLSGDYAIQPAANFSCVRRQPTPQDP